MQMITLTFIFGDAISFYSGYPIKKFKEISTMSLEENATLAVLDLGNDRAKWSILTGKPVYGFDKPEELFADLEVMNVICYVPGILIHTSLGLAWSAQVMRTGF